MVRLTLRDAATPETVTAAPYTSAHGSFRDWRDAAELAWMDEAHLAGLEPTVLEADLQDSEVAKVLVYGVRYVIERNGNIIAARRATDDETDPSHQLPPSTPQEAGESTG